MHATRTVELGAIFFQPNMFGFHSIVSVVCVINQIQLVTQLPSQKDAKLCTHHIFPVSFVFASKHKAESTRCMIVRRYSASIKFFRTRSRHAPKSSRDAQLLVDKLVCPVLNYFVIRTCIYVLWLFLIER